LKNRNIIVTTTSLTQGWEILSYLDTISSHVVAGTNIFSDLLAELSDFFGGRSHTYQKQISIIHQEAIEILKEKAICLGANCIVGLRVDHDEISGKGKSMFMVTATGTAVFAKKSLENDKELKKENILSSFDLAVQMKKREIIKSIKNGNLEFNNDLWNFVIENHIHEISSIIMEKLEKNYLIFPTAEASVAFIKKCEEFFLSLPKDISKTILYNAIHNDKSMFSFIKNIIKDGNLLDFKYINKLLDSKEFDIQKRALELLRYDKSYYTPSDIEQFINLYNKIKSIFFIRVKYIEEKSRLGSSIKKKWICGCGQKNLIDQKYCSSCDKDVYGFIKSEPNPMETLEIIKSKYQILNDIFSES
jgi:uncharacterized protein YbjQ (UPF0145 family)